MIEPRCRGRREHWRRSDGRSNALDCNKGNVMSENQAPKNSVERLPEQRSTVITDELNKILDMLEGACPKGAVISFDFDGRLHVHVDVHNFEDVLKVEGVLPILGGGMFHDMSRGSTPHHPFSHRLSAIVDR